MELLLVKTPGREALVDITGRLQRVLEESGISDGLCCIYVPHTTCGLTINEHADPDVADDLLLALDRMVPVAGFKHREGNSPAHVKTSLVGTALTIMVADYKLCLGTWQGVFLCEFDGPRERKVWIKLITG
jgi:secondary thiamine-phosphate synthase enzyme